MKHKEIYDKSHGKCWYCGVQLNIIGTKERHGGVISDPKPDSFVADHVIPRYYGGSDDKNNLVPCCWKCNCSKRTFDIEKFRFRQMLKSNGVPFFSDEQVGYLYSIGFSFNLPRYEFYFEKMRLKP